MVPFEVATGDSDTACEVPGHGWVTAAHARDVMTRPGSVWATLPVDLATGHAISRPSKSYGPSQAMVEHVQAVDGLCRGPDCQVPAARCDLDHETPWPRGETAVDNLFSKHRRHHNLKTDGLWTSRPSSDRADNDGGTDRALEWTTLTGRTYTTHPKDWRDGLDPPDLPASAGARPYGPVDRAADVVPPPV
ncbi:HNH endonuclease signature motif containing protein [Intrasporangium sp. YIM S08009]|uniref:HNH endonuclease signature motif containing protein n=1 Tax=Intrasporangium zincisolvens TaxID=3080018 RepID=UPI002B058364|nr:HNH endonuclease signature motif containing protein [Intrasporangium sp. YIM S08009]